MNRRDFLAIPIGLAATRRLPGSAPEFGKKAFPIIYEPTWFMVYNNDLDFSVDGLCTYRAEGRTWVWKEYRREGT